MLEMKVERGLQTRRWLRSKPLPSPSLRCPRPRLTTWVSPLPKGLFPPGLSRGHPSWVFTLQEYRDLARACRALAYKYEQQIAAITSPGWGEQKKTLEDHRRTFNG